MFLWGYVDRCPSLLYDVYDLFISTTAKAIYKKTAEAKLYLKALKHFEVNLGFFNEMI